MPDKDGIPDPLVTVIIRSMDRATLAQALDSIASQTYPNIEIVLVDAKGADHSPQGGGRIPLRMVGAGTRLQRGRAANLGLDEARGEYLIFLDDDDWFEPDHLEKLVRALQAHPEVKLVYSGVKCVDGDNNTLPESFAYNLDSTQLLAMNFIPIHAALFSRELLTLGCRVDESLDVYEDWDFWIQASMFTDFLFVEGLSAAYRITAQSGFGVNADNTTALRASLVLYRKWLPRLSDDQVAALMRAVWLNRFRDRQIKDQEQHVRHLEDLLANTNAQLHDKDRQLADMNAQLSDGNAQLVAMNVHLQEREKLIRDLVSSISWRITAPLRKLRMKTKY